LRETIVKPRNVPKSRSGFGSASKAASMSATGTRAVQLWLGLAVTSSPSSGTAGKAPPAVNPPVDDENSVRATPLAVVRRTCPAVCATARSPFVDSNTSTVPAVFVPKPRYTWQKMSSQVSASP
jgi:hypothetical protein